MVSIAFNTILFIMQGKIHDLCLYLTNVICSLVGRNGKFPTFAFREQ